MEHFDRFIEIFNIIITKEKQKESAVLPKNYKIYNKILQAEQIQVNALELFKYQKTLDRLMTYIAKKNISREKLQKTFLSRLKFSTLKTLKTVISKLNPNCALKTRLNKILDQKQEECPICMDNNWNMVYSCCGNQICENCLEKITRCPFCRANMIAVKHREIPTQTKNKKNTKKTILRLVTDQEQLFREFSKILLVGRKITEKTARGIELFFDYDLLKTTDTFFKTDIKSEETRAYIIAYLIYRLNLYTKTKRHQSIKLECFIKLIDTPNRLLRVLAALKCFITKQSVKPEVDQEIIFKTNNTFRTWVMKTVNTWPKNELIYSQLKAHKYKWEKYFKYIHANYKKKYPISTYSNAHTIVNRVLWHKLPLNPNYRLDKYIKTRDSEVFNFLRAHKSMVFRNFRRLAKAFPHYNKWSNLISNMNLEQLMELYHVLKPFKQPKCKIHEDKCVSTLTSKGTLNVRSGYYKQSNNSSARNTIKREIINKLNSIKKDYKLIIIDNTKNRLKNRLNSKGDVPSSTRWSNHEPASRGTKIDLTEQFESKSKLVIFIHWGNTPTGKRVDLDLSVYFLNHKKEYIGLCDYTNLKAFNCTKHSGDITDAPLPNGASEWICIDLNRMPLKIAYVGIGCLSYNKVSFDEMNEAYVGIGYKDTIKHGGPFGCKVIESCKLKGCTQLSLTGYLNTIDKEFVFTNINIKAKSEKYNSISSRQSQLISQLDHFDQWLKTSIAPISWYEVSKFLGTVYGKVALVRDNKTSYYEQRPKETQIQFYDRINDAKDTDNSKYKKDEKPCIYIGEIHDKQIPNKSLNIWIEYPELLQEQLEDENYELEHLDNIFKILVN